MTLKNKMSGDVLEVPPPDSLGHSVVKLNGIEIESVFYGEVGITLGSGRTFPDGDEFATYLVGRLRETQESSDV